MSLIRWFINIMGSDNNRALFHFSETLPPIDNSNYGVSPVRFEYDALLQEFSALREEVKTRIEKQQEITRYAIALAAGLIALFQLMDKKIMLSVSNYYPVLSLALSAFSLMVLEHEVNIAHLYMYIDGHLKRRMTMIVENATGLKPELLEWNKHRARWQQHSRYLKFFTFAMSSSKYAMTIIPNCLLFYLYRYTAFENYQNAILDGKVYTHFMIHYIIWLASVLVFCWVIGAMLFTGALYWKMEWEKTATS